MLLLVPEDHLVDEPVREQRRGGFAAVRAVQQVERARPDVSM